MQNLRSYLAYVILVCALAACAGGTAQTPAQTVYQVQSDYAAALVVAVAYKNLPDCALPGHPVLCSQATIIKQLQDADDIAYPTLTAAQNTVKVQGATNAQTAVNAAQQAVAALTAITSKLVIK
jgi:hypothetical protein